jgi:hypothetical protein
MLKVKYTVSFSYYTALNSGIINEYELERMWKEVFEA